MGRSVAHREQRATSENGDRETVEERLTSLRRASDALDVVLRDSKLVTDRRAA